MNRAFSILVGALLLATVSVAPATADHLHRSGKIAVGGFGFAIGCGESVPCEPTDLAGYDGLSAASVEFSDDMGGWSFDLTASDLTGTPDLDICFYDGAPLSSSNLGCWDSLGDESGTVPAGAHSAYIMAYMGVDITYSLTFS